MIKLIVYYVESYKNNNNNKITKIYHLFMAKEGNEAGNYYNKSTKNYLHLHLISTKTNYYDIIKKFKSYLALFSGEYLEEEIKEESIEYDEYERKFTIIQDKPIILKKYLIDEIEILDFCRNITDIIEPNFDCQIKKDKIIITIELPGEIQFSAFKPRIIPNRGFYYFHFKGTIKFPETEDLCFKEGNMKDDEFRLDFRIPMNIGIIKNSKLKIKINKLNGVVIIIYEIVKEEEEEYDDSNIDM